MDQDAVSAPIGTVLVVAIVVVMGTAAAFFLHAPTPDVDDINAAGRARSIDGDSLVTLMGPDDIPLKDAWVDVQTANGSKRIQLSTLAGQTYDGTHWRVGETLCFAGNKAGCALPAQGASRFTLYTATQQLFTVDLADAGGFAGGSNGLGGSGSPTPPPAPIATCFDILSSGGVSTNCDLSWTSYIVGTQITQGSGGATIHTFLSARPNETTPYTKIFGGNKTTEGAAEWLGNLPSDSRIGLLGEAKLGTFYRAYESDVNDPHVKVLRDGDPVPDAAGYAGQVPVSSMLAPYAQDGKINIGPHEVIVLFEFNDNLASPAADYQDLVVLLQAAHLA